MALLGSLRKLILGETLTIPAGVAGALIVAVLARAALPTELWSSIGGFVLALCLVATLALSLRGRRKRT
jgi:hypothetical protein